MLPDSIISNEPGLQILHYVMSNVFVLRLEENMPCLQLNQSHITEMLIAVNGHKSDRLGAC